MAKTGEFLHLPQQQPGMKPSRALVRFRDEPFESKIMHLVAARMEDCKAIDCEHCLIPTKVTQRYFMRVIVGKDSKILTLPYGPYAKVQGLKQALGPDFFKTEFEITRNGQGIKTEYDIQPRRRRLGR